MFSSFLLKIFIKLKNFFIKNELYVFSSVLHNVEGDKNMTEENIQVKTEEKTCNCICKSEGFRNFVVVALGSFTGVFCAISLFCALHKPPMMPPVHPNMQPPVIIQQMQKPCECGCRKHHPMDFKKPEKPMEHPMKKMPGKMPVKMNEGMPDKILPQ